MKPPQPGLPDPQIIFHDKAIVVIGKPGGMLAVPGRGPLKQDCAAARLQRIFPEMIPQPAVHRLDMFTTGLMVFAVTRHAHRALSRQFEQRSVVKHYVAVLDGRPRERQGEIRLAFRLDPNNRPRQIHDPHQGKPGVTRWHLLEPRDGAAPEHSRVRFTPLTGRTHQLRLHAAHPLGLGCPISGDSLYGSGRDGDPLLLHACRLAFFHPVTGNRMVFCLPPPF